MLTISNQNLQRLASINAKLQITVVDFWKMEYGYPIIQYDTIRSNKAYGFIFG